MKTNPSTTIPAGFTDLRGEVFEGAYEIDQLVAAESRHVVFSGKTRDREQAAVVRLIRPDVPHDDATAKRFARRVKLCRRARHAAIRTPIDSGELFDGKFYVVSDKPEGDTLRRSLMASSSGRLTWAVARDLLLDLVRGLAAMHRRGIPHGSIDPDCCWIQVDGSKAASLVLTGLGSNTDPPVHEGDQELSRTTGVGRDAKFVAPEMLGGVFGDQRSDIYLVGLLAYTMLTGQPPFVGANPFQVASKQLTAEVPPMGEASADLPPGVEAMVVGWLAKEAERRPASMEDVEEALLGFEDGEPSLQIERRATKDAPRKGRGRGRAERAAKRGVSRRSTVEKPREHGSSGTLGRQRPGQGVVSPRPGLQTAGGSLRPPSVAPLRAPKPSVPPPARVSSAAPAARRPSPPARVSSAAPAARRPSRPPEPVASPPPPARVSSAALGPRRPSRPPEPVASPPPPARVSSAAPSSLRTPVPPEPVAPPPPPRRTRPTSAGARAPVLTGEIEDGRATRGRAPQGASDGSNALAVAPASVPPSPALPLEVSGSTVALAVDPAALQRPAVSPDEGPGSTVAMAVDPALLRRPVSSSAEVAGSTVALTVEPVSLQRAAASSEELSGSTVALTVDPASLQRAAASSEELSGSTVALTVNPASLRRPIASPQEGAGSTVALSVAPGSFQREPTPGDAAGATVAMSASVARAALMKPGIEAPLGDEGTSVMSLQEMGLGAPSAERTPPVAPMSSGPTEASGPANSGAAAAPRAPAGSRLGLWMAVVAVTAGAAGIGVGLLLGG